MLCAGRTRTDEKEIGGYFELEDFGGKEYYPNLYKVNLGRTALRWLLEGRGYTKIYLPVFLCESVTEACEQRGIRISRYQLDAELNVLLPRKKLGESECLYLVNYYGQLTDEKILAYQKILEISLWIIRMLSFRKPLKGVDTLYSCRKFWGVSDGAYLSTDAVLPMDKPVDHSNKRMGHILGRYEENAGVYYQEMLQNAARYEGMEIRRMSRLTENLLGAIDYETGRRKREENYRILSEALPSEFIFTRVTPEGPFVYPYYHKEGLKLRRWLAEHKIFVPTYWKNILEECTESSLEYQWAADVLPLPCDQRYGKEEMQYMAERIKEWEQPENEAQILITWYTGRICTACKKSKERGHYTIVCDGYPDGPARQYADASYVIPVTDIDAVAELCQKEKVDGIITSFSDLLMECMVKNCRESGIALLSETGTALLVQRQISLSGTAFEAGASDAGFVKYRQQDRMNINLPK